MGGRLKEIVRNNILEAAFEYDNSGRISKTVMGNMEITRQYTKKSELNVLSAVKSGSAVDLNDPSSVSAAIQNRSMLNYFGYEYDQVSNRSRSYMPHAGLDTRYTYDSLARLTGESSVSKTSQMPQTAAYSYDLAGNRTKREDSFTKSTAQYSIGNKMFQASEDITFHDASADTGDASFCLILGGSVGKRLRVGPRAGFGSIFGIFLTFIGIEGDLNAGEDEIIDRQNVEEFFKDLERTPE